MYKYIIINLSINNPIQVHPIHLIGTLNNNYKQPFENKELPRLKSKTSRLVEGSIMQEEKLQQIDQITTCFGINACRKEISSKLYNQSFVLKLSMRKFEREKKLQELKFNFCVLSQSKLWVSHQIKCKKIIIL